MIFLKMKKSRLNLRNTVKILVACLVAVTIFAGCKKPEEAVPKTIVITNIPTTYDRKIGALTVDKGGPTLAMAIANINGTSATFRLQDNTTKEPWTGTGYCEFVLLIYENSQAISDKVTLWDGYLSSWKISEEITTISWGEFLDFTNTSRSQKVKSDLSSKNINFAELN